jgi:DNA anti-recombination protein RmuC
MAKIRLNRLSDAKKTYDPNQLDQVNKNLEQIVNQLNSNFTQDVQDVNEAEAWFFISQGSC